jgi:hypothetical protein
LFQNSRLEIGFAANRSRIDRTFAAGTPHALFDVEVPEPTAPYPTDYAVSADGQRFLVNTVVDQPTRPALTVILNWTAALNK